MKDFFLFRLKFIDAKVEKALCALCTMRCIHRYTKGANNKTKLMFLFCEIYGMSLKRNFFPPVRFVFIKKWVHSDHHDEKISCFLNNFFFPIRQMVKKKKSERDTHTQCDEIVRTENVKKTCIITYIVHCSQKKIQWKGTEIRDTSMQKQ